MVLGSSIFPVSPCSERLAAVSIMAAGLTHELNNPLAVLGNRIELMQRDAVKSGAGEQSQKDLGVLGQHVERLRGITTNLLSFAREEEDEPCNIVLDELVGRMIRLLERTFTTKGVQLWNDIGGTFGSKTATNSEVASSFRFPPQDRDHERTQSSYRRRRTRDARKSRSAAVG